MGRAFPRYGAAVAALLLLFLAGTAGAAKVPMFSVRIDGKVLRKASGKLVLSLSAFELDGLQEVSLENRKTSEKRTVRLASVYWDISYTEPLPEDLYRSLNPDDWIPYVVWSTPNNLDALRERLSAIYAHQNDLRRELGRALLDDAGGEIKVSSRLTLNKIEKFHRMAAVLAKEYMKRAREKDDLNTFLYPLQIQIGFNPFGSHSPQSQRSALQQVREVIYWEVHRILTQQFGIEESLVDFVFDSPANIRRLLPVGLNEGEDPSDFFPTITLGGDSIDCALYLQRQGFGNEVKHLVRLREFRDPFITDRLVVDMMVNQGEVVGIQGDRVAVSFAPPFMTKGETVYIIADEERREELPIILATPVTEGGYTLSAALSERLVARIRPGMLVRRK
ncbi:MAG: hypothetical protein HZA60_08055 [Deltaproteobacteria bacterium]|nr:hypothetical protein [Deltaproteobacteria bacterium]